MKLIEYSRMATVSLRLLTLTALKLNEELQITCRLIKHVASADMSLDPVWSDHDLGVGCLVRQNRNVPFQCYLHTRTIMNVNPRI
jgi:hypothetical protein